MTRTALLVVALFGSPNPLQGQATTTTPTPTAEAEYQRAAAMVRDGDGEQGRRIVDSLFVRARNGTAEHAEALYWRAALARDARQAEGDYRRLVVEYPLSRRVDRALLALAQLEVARNDRERALAHLVRLEREHPEGESRATAALWTARIRFDMNDAVRACASLGDAQRLAAAGDVELRNQIEYYRGRCDGVAAAAGGERRAAGAEPPATTASTVDRRPSAAETPTTSTTPPSPAGTADGRRPTADAVPNAPDARRPTSYAIQIAAYDTRAEAEALVRRLGTRRVTARVLGTTKPFRVRTGSHASRDQANAALRELRARGIHGIVVEDSPPPAP